MIEILTYVSLISGGILVLLLVISLVAGMEFETEVADGDVDSGGIGILKSALMFLSVGSWVIKMIVETEQSIYIAILAGILAGAVSVAFLSWVFSLLLKNQHNVNWSPHDAIGLTGKVYLKIPKKSSGIITVEIAGVKRELKAKTTDKKDIPTGAEILVNDYSKGYAKVSLLNS